MKTPQPFCLSESVSRRDVFRKHWLPALAGSVALSAGALWPQIAMANNARDSARSKPDRLISLGGGITEVVYALGAQAMLVGTDTTSLFPLAAQQTPKVGYLRSLSAEGLLALRPTAMVTSSEAGPPVVLDQLRSAGVRIEAVHSDHTWAEVQRKVMAVGRVTHLQSQAQAIWTQLDQQWQRVQQQVSANKAARKPKVLFILSHSGSPMVSGEGTAAHAVIQFLGGQNALSGFTGYRPMTAEAMAAAAPDTLLLTTQGIEAMGGVDKFWQRPELQLTPAWRNRSSARSLVHRDALELIGFTPRMPQLIEQLHRHIVLS
jgi:iron complex transport system substrate-binding protein